jgi:hypothetical protein
LIALPAIAAQPPSPPPGVEELTKRKALALRAI